MRYVAIINYFVAVGTVFLNTKLVWRQIIDNEQRESRTTNY